jgi:hypothetical protein
MNFQVSLGEASSQELRIVIANSWSTCLAYCEGVGSQLNSINQIDTVNMVIVDSGTNSCYQVNLKSGSVVSNYMVWASSYSSLNTWLDSQVNVEVAAIQFANKLYVTL